MLPLEPEELPEHRKYWKYRVWAVAQAEEAGMTSYLRNIYADFLCAYDIDELKTVAADLSRYKLHLIRRPEVVQADLDGAKTRGGRDVEKYEKEILVSEAYSQNNVFEMLAKLRELYTRLYDELKKPLNLG